MADADRVMSLQSEQPSASPSELDVEATDPRPRRRVSRAWLVARSRHGDVVW